ncbi:MAG: DnaA ATPase domain-containing protein [Pirellulales bacterium]
MGNAPEYVDAAGMPGADAAATRVLEVFRARLGEDRFAVWFGAGVRVTVAPAAEGRHGLQVTITAGDGFQHEWLRRTFRGEFAAAVRDACGPAEVSWEPAAADAGETPSKPSAPAAPRGREGSAGPSRRGASKRALVVAPRQGDRTLTARPQSPAAGPRPARQAVEFVVGPSNRMAFGAVEMALSRPGEITPLVIHGPSGVGKSHLLEATCDRAREMHPGGTVVSLSAEQFTTAFLQALHGGGLPGFRRTCRGADILVIDDLQFFVGKKATVEELQHTIDALQRLGRQVVLACDREIDALTQLGPDLLTRLRGGMVARMLSPDYEVRRGIVAALCGKRGLAVPDDVIHYVASMMTRHARELIGAVNRLEAASLMLGTPIALAMAEEALADLVRSSSRSLRLADIERAVCRAFGIDSGSLQSSRRARTVSHPRMLAMFLARKHTQAPLTEIGSYFGRRSHSTVIAAQKTVDAWMATRSPIVLADASWDVEEAIRRVEDVLRAG